MSLLSRARKVEVDALEEARRLGQNVRDLFASFAEDLTKANSHASVAVSTAEAAIADANERKAAAAAEIVANDGLLKGLKNLGVV